MKDFKSQSLERYAQPKDLLQCEQTIRLLKKENPTSNKYTKLADKFKLYKEGKLKEESADYYFYMYLQSLENKNKYTFPIGDTTIDIPINVLEPFVEIDGVTFVHPHWHLIISYYAYIDAMYNHDDNEYASKIKQFPDSPTGRFFEIRCKSLLKWIEEAFK